MKHYHLGQVAEKTAANYLVAQGYDLLDAHYYNKKGYHFGEIDLVAQDNKNEEIVFVEVKSRKGKNDSVIPEENITVSKIKKIQKTAMHYLKEKKLIGKDWRVDSIAVVFDFKLRKMALRHIKHIRL